MSSFYYEDANKSIIKAELLTDRAQVIAQSLRGKMKSSQLMRFYTDIKNLERRVESEGGESSFQKFLPILKLTLAKAAYAHGRKSKGKRLIADEFKSFLDEAIKAVSDYKDFKAFCLYFEAVVGYAKEALS